MYRTFATAGLVFLEGATVQAPEGVGKKLLTLLAECIAFRCVPIFAETPDHHFHGPSFPLHAFFEKGRFHMILSAVQ